jgi:hypothetical protein
MINVSHRPSSLQWYEFTVVRVDNKTNESVNRSRKRLNRGVISVLQRNAGKAINHVDLANKCNLLASPTIFFRTITINCTYQTILK